MALSLLWEGKIGPLIATPVKVPSVRARMVGDLLSRACVVYKRASATLVIIQLMQVYLTITRLLQVLRNFTGNINGMSARVATDCRASPRPFMQNTNFHTNP